MSVNFIHLFSQLDLTRSSCGKCNYRTSGRNLISAAAESQGCRFDSCQRAYVVAFLASSSWVRSKLMNKI